MYRHLLVPIDNTDLSTSTVGQAVEFARAVGARITFFHAQSEHPPSLHNDVGVVHSTSTEDFSSSFEGQIRELMTKAVSAAGAQGVPCSCATAISDTPYNAILATAQAEGCDLIFMSSHERHSAIGMAPGSQMQKLLANAKIPVLISATSEPPAQAIETIQGEHRYLDAVLHAWLRMLKSAEKEKTPLDQALMSAMVHYIQFFMTALHHPKEQKYLFRKLRERTSAVNAELDELERQHERDEQLVADLAALVARYATGDVTPGAIEQAVSAYATFIWEHIGREEGVILPAAQRYLTDEDWGEINDAFSENQRSQFNNDMDDQFRRLFSRIVNLSASSTQ